MDLNDTDKFKININVNIIEVLQKIDKNGKGILFVVNESNILLGCISDGDIRRWLLNGGNLNDMIEPVMNSNPIYVHSEEIKQAAELLEVNEIPALPVIDDSRHLIDIVLRNYLNKHVCNSKGSILGNIPVVIMAGGQGTRLYPYTKVLPKPLLPIGDIPIIERIMDGFALYGCKQFYLIVNYKAGMIKAYFSDITKNYLINYIEETVPLGTGGGLSYLKELIHGTFILSNCDIIINDNFEKIYEHHQKEGNYVTIVCSLKKYEIPYGVVEFGTGGIVHSMQEKPNLSFFTNTGFYIVESDILNCIGNEENISFPEIIKRAQDDDKKVGVYPINESAWMDMGQIDTMEQMRKRLEKLDE